MEPGRGYEWFIVILELYLINTKSHIDAYATDVCFYHAIPLKPYPGFDAVSGPLPLKIQS